MKVSSIILLNLCLLWQNGKIYASQVSASAISVQSPSQEAALFPNLKKINDDLYVGKVKDKFYLAMERIDHNNIKSWLGYANNQYGAALRMNLKNLPSSAGSGSFQQVLKAYQSSEIGSYNELWVAYASDIPVKDKASLNYFEGGRNPHIEMFVTVITSPDALITSHMGISRTWEAALSADVSHLVFQQEIPKRLKQPDQSVHLHSFAAKVMKTRDPKKVYMLTPPTVVMRNILIQKMPPHSVFVGDSLYQKTIENAEKDPKSLLSPWDLKESNWAGETAQEREKRLKETVERTFKSDKIQEKISLLTTNPPRIIREKDKQNQKFTIQKPDGSPLVTFDQSTTTYQWMFTNAYQDKGLDRPYVLVDLEKLAAVSTLVPDLTDYSSISKQ